MFKSVHITKENICQSTDVKSTFCFKWRLLQFKRHLYLYQLNLQQTFKNTFVLVCCSWVQKPDNPDRNADRPKAEANFPTQDRSNQPAPRHGPLDKILQTCLNCCVDSPIGGSCQWGILKEKAELCQPRSWSRLKSVCVSSWGGMQGLSSYHTTTEAGCSQRASSAEHHQ